MIEYNQISAVMLVGSSKQTSTLPGFLKTNSFQDPGLLKVDHNSSDSSKTSHKAAERRDVFAVF